MAVNNSYTLLGCHIGSKNALLIFLFHWLTLETYVLGCRILTAVEYDTVSASMQCFTMAGMGGEKRRVGVRASSLNLGYETRSP